MAKKSLSKAEVKAAADRAEDRSKKSKSTKKADVKPKAKDKKKAAAAPEPEKTEERPLTGARVISQNDLRNLLKSIKLAEGEKDEAVGIIREKIGFAVEKKNLNKVAFAYVRKFDKMEAEKLADLWDTLELYMEMTGLFDRIESVAKLPFDAPKEPQEGEDDGEQAKEEPAPPAETVSKPRLVSDNSEAAEKIPA